MAPFVIADENDISLLLSSLEDKLTEPIPGEKLQTYEGFVRGYLGEEFHDISEAIDTVLLFSYIMGDQPIVGIKTGEARRIKTLDDLTLLSVKNCRAKDESKNYYNLELSRILSRIKDRHRSYQRKNFEQTVNAIFKTPHVIECLDGKATYAEHVMEKRKSWPLVSARKDAELLKLYILGRIPIVDAETGNKRTIQSIDDLTLLSCTKVSARNDHKDLYNREVYNLYHRILNRNRRYNTPVFEKTIDAILKEPEVIKYFGGKACFKKHIRMGFRRPIKFREEDDISLLKEYVLGEIPIIDLKTREERRIRDVSDLTLLSQMNIRGKKWEEKDYNPDLHRLFYRIRERYRTKDSLNRIEPEISVL